MTDLIALCLTWLACLWFGPAEPEDDLSDLLAAWGDRRGLEVIELEHSSHTFAVAYDEAHAFEAGELAGKIVARGFEEERKATARI